jgi:pimeloyl-ACP methyl ester carboxylesterase
MIGIGVSFGGALLLIGAVGWYYAGEIKNGALDVNYSPSEPDLIVAAVDGDQVTLAVTDSTDLIFGRWQSNGLYGIEWDGGYAQAGPIIKISENQVTREFISITGQLSAGQAVSLDATMFYGDPWQAYGIATEAITFTSELGDFDAWYVDGDDTWVVYIHGKGASRRESLRMLPVVTEMGFSSLVITYRNDEGLPDSNSGYYDYGLTEWADLEAAVQYAIDNGAVDIVLVGYSMGGAITAGFLYESDLAETIISVILDAPMTDFGDVIEFAAEQRKLPSLLTSTAKFIAKLRFGIDWDALDYLERIDELDTPVLVFHGGQDRTIPHRQSDQLANARPDLVTYIQVPQAGHTGSWNVEPEQYETAVESFLGGYAVSALR